MCSRGSEGHKNDKFFIYKTCEKNKNKKYRHIWKIFKLINNSENVRIHFNQSDFCLVHSFIGLRSHLCHEK